MMFDQSPSAAPSSKPSTARPLSSGQIRKSCDVCSRAKKKCDGNNPCMCCIRLNMVCKYSAKLKPGPHGNSTANSLTKKLKILPSLNHCFSVSAPPPVQTAAVLVQQRVEEVSAFPALGSPTEKTAPLLQSVNCQSNMLDSSRLLKSSEGPERPKVIDSRQLCPKKTFGQREIFFLQLHLRLTNNSMPLCNDAVISDGIQWISKSDEAYNADRAAAVAITWCVCALGASAMHDSVMLWYVRFARDALHSVFDESSDLVARAFFALEIVSHICGGICSEASVNLKYRMGLYRELGEALLAAISPEDIDPATNALLFQARSIQSSFGNNPIKMRDMCRYRDLFVVSPAITDKIGPIQISSHGHKVAAEWTRRFSAWRICDSRRPDTGAVDSTTPADHAKAMLLDAYHLNQLGAAGIESDSVSFIFLQMSINMHRLQLGPSEAAAACHELARLCLFVAKRPLLVSTPSVWSCLRAVLCALYQYDMADSRLHVESVGRILIRGMRRLCRLAMSEVAYHQIPLSWESAHLLSRGDTENHALEELMRRECPEVFKPATAPVELLTSDHQRMPVFVGSHSFQLADVLPIHASATSNSDKTAVSGSGTTPKRSLTCHAGHSEIVDTLTSMALDSASEAGRPVKRMRSPSDDESESILFQLADLAAQQPLLGDANGIFEQMNVGTPETFVDVISEGSDSSAETDVADDLDAELESCGSDSKHATGSAASLSLGGGHILDGTSLQTPFGTSGSTAAKTTATSSLGLTAASPTGADSIRRMSLMSEVASRSASTSLPTATTHVRDVGPSAQAARSMTGALAPTNGSYGAARSSCVALLATMKAEHIAALLHLSEQNNSWSPCHAGSAKNYSRDPIAELSPAAFDNVAVVYDVVMDRAAEAVASTLPDHQQHQAEHGIVMHCLRLLSTTDAVIPTKG